MWKMKQLCSFLLLALSATSLPAAPPFKIGVIGLTHGHVAGFFNMALKREDKASSARAVIATAKAAGCLSMGFGGREVARRAQGAPAFYGTLAMLLPNGLLPVPGGVLIRDASGTLLGAVGVTGDSSDNDELCALAGIAAAGLVADTGASA